MQQQDKAWWKEVVIYQVYPRSFKDSNGDGIGDLPGLISKLDYLQSLGVGLVWLNPVYMSPNDDNGYDISNYEAILPTFGTISDFNALLTGLHARGIKLIMDLVVNHTSDEHPWFVESRKSRDNPYRDYYHWWPAEKGTPPFRHSFFDPNAEGWQYDAATDAYYLHYFSRKQPDLNWENPKVRQEIYEMLRFWLNKGIDGFRLDAISYIAKDTSWPVVTKEDLKKNYHNDWSYVYASGQHLHEYLQEMNREVLSQYDIVTIAETPGIKKSQALDFVHEDRHELSMLYHFEGMGIGYLPNEFKRRDPAGYSLPAFKKLYSDWNKVFEQEGWGTIYLGNHDQPRMVSHWGHDGTEYRDLSAKMLFTFLLTMRATPFIYNGDEIGMVNIKFERIEDYQDIETRQVYQRIKDSGGDVDAFIKDQQLAGRDNGRTPFQWNNRAHGGFTRGEPWLKVHPNYSQINAAAQENDPSSVLHFVRYLISLRKSIPALVYGKYELLLPEHPHIYAYYRRMEDDCCLVMLNFTSREVSCPMDCSIPVGGEILVNNYSGIKERDSHWWLRPYQALVCREKKPSG